MAISKTQPMRSAEIELVDSVNQLESDLATEVGNRMNADTALGARIDDEILAREGADTALGTRIDNEILAREGADTALGARIDDEILAREGADTALGNRISDEAGARANADTEIVNLIGTGFSASNTIASNIESLQGFDSRFRIGMTEAYTIAASGAQAVSVTFNNPYEATDAILAFVNPIASAETITTLGCVLDAAGPQGLRATINNSDPDNAYTVALGFIAIKVN